MIAPCDRIKRRKIGAGPVFFPPIIAPQKNFFEKSKKYDIYPPIGQKFAVSLHCEERKVTSGRAREQKKPLGTPQDGDAKRRRRRAAGPRALKAEIIFLLGKFDIAGNICYNENEEKIGGSI